MASEEPQKCHQMARLPSVKHGRCQSRLAESSGFQQVWRFLLDQVLTAPQTGLTEFSSPDVSSSAPLLLVLLGPVFSGSSPPTLNCFLVLPQISELALVVGSSCIQSPSGDCLFRTVDCVFLSFFVFTLFLSLSPSHLPW